MPTFLDHIKSICARYKAYFLSLALIGVVAAIAQVMVSYKIKEIIDAIQANPNDNIAYLLLLFVGYKSLYHGVFFIRRLLEIKYSPSLVVETVTTMYERTLRHSLHWFDSHLSGEISSKISDFQSNLLPAVSYCAEVLKNFSVILISVVFLLEVNLSAASVVIGFIFIYTPIIFLLLRKQLQLQQQYVAASQKALGIINDSVANVFSVKVIGNVLTELKMHLSPALEKWRWWERKTRQFDAYWVDAADTIMVVIMGAIQIYLLSGLYQAGEITAGGFAFVAMVTLSIHDELGQLLESLLFNINPSIASLSTSYSFINSCYDTLDRPDASVLANVKGDIKFNNVSFSYSDSNKQVLRNFSLHITPGQRIGVVGTSGAGKTTLIKCLLRYFDVNSGQVLVDGKDISEVTQSSLRSHISVIPQDVTMFHRTILENLQVVKPEASFDEIVLACKKARVHHDIERMEDGYNSIVGERGVKVSGGQRQRIAIARAILKNAPILILDEATSALDSPTEKLIQQSLHEMLSEHNATTIVIAHRLSTLLHMDRILVLDHGQIIEDGSHNELLAKGGLYRQLWEAQVSGFISEEDIQGKPCAAY